MKEIALPALSFRGLDDQALYDDIRGRFEEANIHPIQQDEDGTFDVSWYPSPADGDVPSLIWAGDQKRFIADHMDVLFDIADEYGAFDPIDDGEEMYRGYRRVCLMEAAVTWAIDQALSQLEHQPALIGAQDC